MDGLRYSGRVKAGLGAAMLLLAATALAGCGSGSEPTEATEEPTPAQEASPATAAGAANPGETLVEIVLTGNCPTECIVEAKNGSELIETLTFREVGEAQSFTTASELTTGMYFTVDSVEAEAWAVTVAALRPSGAAVGESVAEVDVVSMPAGYVCWAGTTESRADITMVMGADYEESIIAPGTYVPVVKAWASPALPTVGDPFEAYEGHLGYQNSPITLGGGCELW